MLRPASLLLLCSTFLSAAALYSRNSAVQTVGPSELKKLERGDSLILVEVFAPWCGHCRNLVPEMEKAAKALKGVVAVTAVDADVHKDLAGRFQVQGFPTILLLGPDRSKPIPYNGGRTAKDIAHFALREAGKVVDTRLGLKGGSGKKSSSGSGSSSSDAVELTDANFEETVLGSDDVWMVEFYAPWCGHCKNLAPEWASAATQLKGTGAKLGMVDATVHQSLASKYGIQGYPTIKVFAKGGVSDYEGPRSAGGIVDYAYDQLEKFGKGGTVTEVTTKDEMFSNCLERAGTPVCVLAVLPHVMETGAEGRKKYLDTLQQVSKELRSLKSMTYVWVAGGEQTHLEQAFGIEFNYPIVVAINYKKKVFGVHRGAFSVKAIAKTLGGRLSTKAIRDVSIFDKFVKTEAWDGKDYTPPVEDSL